MLFLCTELLYFGCEFCADSKLLTLKFINMCYRNHFKRPGLKELGCKELQKVNGGWKFNPIGIALSCLTIFGNIIYNLEESKEIYNSSAQDELNKIRSGY